MDKTIKKAIISFIVIFAVTFSAMFALQWGATIVIHRVLGIPHLALVSTVYAVVVATVVSVIGSINFD